MDSIKAIKIKTGKNPLLTQQTHVTETVTHCTNLEILTCSNDNLSI